MVGGGEGLTPRQVVIVDDTMRYGHQLRDMVTDVLGRGRADGDRAECISHQEAISASDEFWAPYAVALVDSRDTHGDREGTPVPVGDVVRRLNQLAAPPKIVVYSANFDNPYFHHFVRQSAKAVAYYHASALLDSGGVAMRSALLDDQPRHQAESPRPEQLGDLGEDADLGAAMSALRDDPQTWRWALGFTPWRAVDAYRQRKVRTVARERLKMRPENRPIKIRDRRELKDRNAGHGSILEVVQDALGLRESDQR